MESNKNKTSQSNKYVALFRGINVGGHHKVPMAEVKIEMTKLGFTNISTILNSGNVLFESDSTMVNNIESSISKHMETVFGFPIPTLVRSGSEISDIISTNPFIGIEANKTLQLYISFLRNSIGTDQTFPQNSLDNSYSIVGTGDRIVFSKLDTSKNPTPKAMELLERLYGKDITTRNLNTIVKIAEKLS